MKIVALGCIHNDIGNLLNLLEKVSELKPDIIVSVGDITDSTFPKGFNSKDIGKLVLTEFRLLKKPILITPGSWDKDLIELFRREGVLIHGNGVIINNVGFYGFGGAQTPFNTPYEPSDGETLEGLKKAYEEVKTAKYKIQLTHAPPINTVLDIIPNGQHVGSEVIRNFIEEKQPDVAVCAHIHEGVGIDQIGKTKVINVGKFTEGYCGLVEIDKKIDVKIVELV